MMTFYLIYLLSIIINANLIIVIIYILIADNILLSYKLSTSSLIKNTDKLTHEECR